MCILEPKEGQNCTFITGVSLKVQRRAEDEKARKGDGNRMGRLTQKDDAGYWTLKSIPWGMLREGRIITKEVGQAIYGALCKLKDYEDTGLEPGKLQEMDEEYQELAKEVARLREKERWNPVEEKFPEDDNYILLSFENLPLPSIGRYETDQDGGAFYLEDDDKSCISRGFIVNAWKPLPERYQGDEE